MKRIRNLVMFAMLVGATFLPGASMTVSAQDADFCSAAAEAATGGASEYAGYAIVYGSGGSGSQIVLGSSEGGSVLSGGSGNDVLCAWGNGNTLDGGSGSDVLIAVDGEGNLLVGGSGNDTLMGYINNTFDGGSGRNEIVKWEPVLGTITVSVGTLLTDGVMNCGVQVELIDFADGDYTVHTDVTGFLSDDSTFTSVSGYASGVSFSWGYGQFESGTVEVTAGGATSGSFTFANCSSLPPID